jgi:hypothetical protein
MFELRIVSGYFQLKLKSYFYNLIYNNYIPRNSQNKRTAKLGNKDK